MISPETNQNSSSPRTSGGSSRSRLHGKRVAVVVFSHYPSDPRPRRAAEVLVQLGMKVEVLCLVQDKGESRHEVYNGVNIRRISLKRRRGGKFSYVFQYSSFIFISFVILAFRSLRRRYDLVHVHNMPDVLVFAALIPRIFGAKVILDLHDPMPELMKTIYNLKPESLAVRLLKKFERWSIHFADVVLTVNQACQKLFASRGCPPEKIHVVMNSPDEGIFKYRDAQRSLSERTRTEPFVIMYHGSLVERHGLDIGVRALGLIQEAIPLAELRIYGQRTPFLDRVLNSVQGSSLEKSVRYLGPRTLEQIAGAIDECDVGIIPNRRSIFTEINTPTRIFEYLSRGKPVIAPAVPGIQDYFSDGQLVFFQLGDANDLARRLEFVRLNPEAVAKTVELGQAVYRNHRWSEEQIKFTNLVDELLAVHG